MDKLILIIFLILVALFLLYILNLEFFLFVNSYKYKRIILVEDNGKKYSTLLYEDSTGNKYSYADPQGQSGLILLEENGGIIRKSHYIKSWYYETHIH